MKFLMLAQVPVYFLILLILVFSLLYLLTIGGRKLPNRKITLQKNYLTEKSCLIRSKQLHFCEIFGTKPHVYRPTTKILVLTIERLFFDHSQIRQHAGGAFWEFRSKHCLQVPRCRLSALIDRHEVQSWSRSLFHLTRFVYVCLSVCMYVYLLLTRRWLSVSSLPWSQLEKSA